MTAVAIRSQGRDASAKADVAAALAAPAAPTDAASTSAMPTHVCVLTTIGGCAARGARFYVIYRQSGEGLAPDPFVPLLQFFLDRGVGARLPWQRTHARSVQLLLDHLAAYGNFVEAAPANALQRFVDDLVAGTVDDDGRDTTGLHWLPHSPAVVEAHLARITAFADWLAERSGNAPLNAWRTARPDERILQLRRFDRRASHALLAHAAYRAHESAAAARVRAVRAPRRQGGLFDELRAFDEKALLRLF